MKKTAWLACFISFLTACVPIRQRYLRVEAPEAVYLPGACDSSGPRSWAYFPMNGIFVSMNLSAKLFGIHYPNATTVQLDSNELTGSGSLNGKLVTWRAILTPTRHDGRLGDPVEFQDMIDPITSSSDRKTRSSTITWANYYLGDPLLPNHIVVIPRNFDQASLLIPPMTIEGKKYDARELRIVQQSHFWMAPVNGC